MTQEEPELLPICRKMAEKIDGLIEGHRVVSHVGANRTEALGSTGRDDEAGLSSQGDPAVQIEDFAKSRIEAHRKGPAAYMYLVLRKAGATGNVAISPAIAVGGEDARATLVQQRGDATHALANMAPKALDLMSGLLLRFMAYAEKSRDAELTATVAMAEAVGFANASDENAKYEAMAQAAAAVSPVLGQAVQAWKDATVAKATKAPQEAGLQDAAAYLRNLKPEVLAELLAALKAEMESGQQDAGRAEPEAGASP